MPLYETTSTWLPIPLANSTLSSSTHAWNTWTKPQKLCCSTRGCPDHPVPYSPRKLDITYYVRLDHTEDDEAPDELRGDDGHNGVEIEAEVAPSADLDAVAPANRSRSCVVTSINTHLNTPKYPERIPRSTDRVRALVPLLPSYALLQQSTSSLLSVLTSLFQEPKTWLSCFLANSTAGQRTLLCIAWCFHLAMLSAECFVVVFCLLFHQKMTLIQRNSRQCSPTTPRENTALETPFGHMPGVRVETSGNLAPNSGESVIENRQNFLGLLRGIGIGLGAISQILSVL